MKELLRESMRNLWKMNREIILAVEKLAKAINRVADMLEEE